MLKCGVFILLTEMPGDGFTYGVSNFNFYPGNTSITFKNSSSTKRFISNNKKRYSFASPSVVTTCNILFHSFWYLPPYFSMNMCIMPFAHTWPIIILTPNLLNLKPIKPLNSLAKPIKPINSLAHSLNVPIPKSWERNLVPSYVFIRSPTTGQPGVGCSWVPTGSCCQG